MWKLIFLGIVIWLIIKLAKYALKANQNNSPEVKSSEEANIENMVECDQCHVHLPRSEAFLVDGKFYCTKAHIKSDAP
ncbi:MAG: PP0621 family protein [Methylotenera sp.]|jgi:formylmethanofuran dehydrogenase subunit E|uniref:PP0621 family protein n=1 Tax=Methylotenera sp. TaxID=2051956 RepID=UPI00271CDD98|nr:PP0621 family protein [Methylotenera sp.]MDO9151805.1 PP0621 family protein [Methylotenera sp.]